MSVAVEAHGLGKCYRQRWALTDCSLTVPTGHVVGLVGPNGAGKTTLLQLAVGLLAPSSGTIEVFGRPPGDDAEILGRVGFVAQDTPNYSSLSVADHLTLGAHLNPRWDGDVARHRIEKIGLEPSQHAGRLSGGERAQLALTMALAKRPDLLILDEPVASLDPLARREFLQTLMEDVAAHDLGVILSSHLVADIERVCDYLIVLVDSRVQLSGDVDELLASHHRLVGPRGPGAPFPASQEVIDASHTERQTTLIVRSHGPVVDSAWMIEPTSLEDLVLAYMARGSTSHGAARASESGAEA